MIRSIKRWLDYIWGDDFRSFRDAWEDQDWGVVIPAVIANVVAISCIAALWLTLLTGSIHILAWFGWMP